MSSVFNKIGIKEVLAQLGLNEGQLESMLENRIAELRKQESVLLKTVDDLARQSNELYDKRRENAVATESFKTQVEENEKKINLRLGELQKKEKSFKDDETNLLIRQERFNVDKEAFNKERSIFASQTQKKEAEIEKAKSVLSELSIKEKKVSEDYELLESKRVQTERGWESLKSAEKDLQTREKELSAKESALREKEESVNTELVKNNDKLNATLAKIEKERQDLVKAKETHEKEASAEFENLKHRKLEVIRKEKELASKELDVKARLDNVELKEDALKTKPEKKKKAE